MFYAILPAAGSSSRMAGVNKLLARVKNKAVLSYTVETFLKTKIFEQIVIVCPKALIDEYQNCLIKDLGQEVNLTKVQLTSGAETRQASVYMGLQKLLDLGIKQDQSFIAIHDAARCLIKSEKILELCALVKEKMALTAAVPVVDTIKRADQELKITETVDRENLWRIQTPQIFQSKLIFSAHQLAIHENLQATDDASLVERISPVYLAQGQESNIKITYLEDLQRLEG